MEAQAIAEVHELVARFRDDCCTVEEIRASVSGKQRWLATRFTPPDHPLFSPLMAMLDALMAADQEMVVTDQGRFLLTDLIEAHIRVIHRDGCEIICLAMRQPWANRPDPEYGIDGIRGDPFFRPAAEWGHPSVGSFGVGVRPAEATPREPEFWEVEDTAPVGRHVQVRGS